MGKAFYWFRFWCAAHGKGKIAALDDGEFRLLTRIWALGRESERPGWVSVAPGEGWKAADLFRTAGCRRGKPDAMLRRLEQLRCITVHEGGVIEVHDWEDHNPPTPPSKLPEARRHQKRKERGTVSPGDNVATPGRQPGDGASDTLPGRQDVGRQEVEVEEEEDQKREKHARSPARVLPLDVLGQARAAEYPALAKALEILAAGGLVLSWSRKAEVNAPMNADAARLGPERAAAALHAAYEREPNSSAGWFKSELHRAAHGGGKPRSVPAPVDAWTPNPGLPKDAAEMEREYFARESPERAAYLAERAAAEGAPELPPTTQEATP